MLPPPKKDVANALLERSSVFIHMDPRPDEVKVPPQFKKAPQLVLQIGLDMPIPIPDLEVDDDGIRCTLSFSRTPFYCIVPWSAIYALVGDDGRGMVWPEDVPPEVAKQTPGRGATAPGKPTAAKREEKAPRSKRPRAAPKTAGDLDAEVEQRGVRTKLVGLTGDAAEEPKPEAAAAEGSAPPADDAEAEAPKPAAAPAPGRKPKRELPPYLRVVK